MENKKDKDHEALESTADSRADAAGQGSESAAPEDLGAGPDAARAQSRLTPTLEGLAAEVARLSEEMQRQKMAFQDIEVSLVTRIADVDDDRRQAATRLTRTLQGHREELDARFRRQTLSLVLMLLLFLLVVAGGLAFAYFQMKEVHESQRAELQELQQSQQPSAPPQANRPDPLTRKKLSELSQAVDEISLSLERLGSATEPYPAQSQQQSAAPAAPIDEKTEAAAPEEAVPTAATEPLAEASPAAVEPLASEEDRTVQDAGEPSQNVETTPEPAPAETAPSNSKPGTEVPTAEAQEQSSEQTASAAERRVGDTPFTVQLMGFFSLASMEKFIQEHQLEGDLYYQTTVYQGRPWFVLIDGMHPTQGAAESAVANLPEDLTKLDIWIRRLDADKTVTRVSQDQN